MIPLVNISQHRDIIPSYIYFCQCVYMCYWCIFTNWFIIHWFICFAFLRCTLIFEFGFYFKTCTFIEYWIVKKLHVDLDKPEQVLSIPWSRWCNCWCTLMMLLLVYSDDVIAGVFWWCNCECTDDVIAVVFWWWVWQSLQIYMCVNTGKHSPTYFCMNHMKCSMHRCWQMYAEFYPFVC